MPQSYDYGGVTWPDPEDDPNFIGPKQPKWIPPWDFVPRGGKSAPAAPTPPAASPDAGYAPYEESGGGGGGYNEPTGAWEEVTPPTVAAERAAPTLDTWVTDATPQPQRAMPDYQVAGQWSAQRASTPTPPTPPDVRPEFQGVAGSPWYQAQDRPGEQGGVIQTTQAPPQVPAFRQPYAAVAPFAQTAQQLARILPPDFAPGQLGPVLRAGYEQAGRDVVGLLGNIGNVYAQPQLDFGAPVVANLWEQLGMVGAPGKRPVGGMLNVPQMPPDFEPNQKQAMREYLWRNSPQVQDAIMQERQRTNAEEWGGLGQLAQTWATEQGGPLARLTEFAQDNPPPFPLQVLGPGGALAQVARSFPKWDAQTESFNFGPEYNYQKQAWRAMMGAAYGTPEQVQQYREQAPLGLQMVLDAGSDPLLAFDPFFDKGILAYRAFNNARKWEPLTRVVNGVARVVPVEEVGKRLQDLPNGLRRILPWTPTREALASSLAQTTGDVLTRLDELVKSTDDVSVIRRFADNPDAEDIVRLTGGTPQTRNGQTMLTGGWSQSKPAKQAAFLLRNLLGEVTDDTVRQAALRVAGLNDEAAALERKATELAQTAKRIADEDQATFAAKQAAGPGPDKTRKAENAVKQAEAKVAEAQAQVQRGKVDPQVAQARLTAAQSRLSVAQDALQRIQNPPAPAAYQAPRRVSEAQNAATKAAEVAQRARQRAEEATRSAPQKGQVRWDGMEDKLRKIVSGDDAHGMLVELAQDFEDVAKGIFNVKPAPKASLRNIRTGLWNVFSVAYLGRNPGYAFRNGANNLLTAMADGVNPLLTTDMVRDLFVRWGIPPLATVQGIGAAGETWKSRDAMAQFYQELSKPITFGETFKGLNLLTPSLKWAQNLERYASQQIMAHHLMKFWTQTWPRRVATLTQELAQRAPDLTPNQLRAYREALAGTMNPQEAIAAAQRVVGGTSASVPDDIVQAAVAAGDAPLAQQLDNIMQAVDEPAAREALTQAAEVANAQVGRTAQAMAQVDELVDRVSQLDAPTVRNLDADAYAERLLDEYSNYLTETHVLIQEQRTAYEQALDAVWQLIGSVGYRNLDARNALWRSFDQSMLTTMQRFYERLALADEATLTRFGYAAADLTKLKAWRSVTFDTWQQSKASVRRAWDEVRKAKTQLDANAAWRKERDFRNRLWDDWTNQRNIQIADEERMLRNAIKSRTQDWIKRQGAAGWGMPQTGAAGTPPVAQNPPAVAASPTTTAGAMPPSRPQEPPVEPPAAVPVEPQPKPGAPSAGAAPTTGVGDDFEQALAQFETPETAVSGAPAQAAPASPIVPAAVAPSTLTEAPARTHWSRDETARKRFWAYATGKKPGDLGLPEDEVYKRLGVTRLHEFTGNEQDARRLMYEGGRNAPPPSRQMPMADELRRQAAEGKAAAPAQAAPARPVGPQVAGNETSAFGILDPNMSYRFRYKVVSLDDLVTSHFDSFAENPDFPKDLQPRLRDRLGSQEQIDNMARNLSPDGLLEDLRALDRGPMIVGPDNLVESGNGRTLAIRKARAESLPGYQAYQDQLRNTVARYGIDPAQLNQIESPVLVRERLTEVNRKAFVDEANASNVLAMAPFEQALQDAKRINDGLVGLLNVGTDQSIDQALRSPSNRQLVQDFMATLPANERAALLDAQGALNPNGLARLKNALFAKTYPGDAGQRLTQTFTESLDPGIKQIESGMFASLPRMARAESLIRSGAREAGLSLADDMAAAVDMLARLKQQGLRVDDFLAQTTMFERELTPFQEELLAHLNQISRSPKRVREVLNGYADAVEAAPAAAQIGLFGDVDMPTKESIYERIRQTQAADIEDAGPLFAQEATRPAFGATGTRLEEPPAQAAKVAPPAAAQPVAPAALTSQQRFDWQQKINIALYDKFDSVPNGQQVLDVAYDAANRDMEYETWVKRFDTVDDALPKPKRQPGKATPENLFAALADTAKEFQRSTGADIRSLASKMQISVNEAQRLVDLPQFDRLWNIETRADLNQIRFRDGWYLDAKTGLIGRQNASARALKGAGYKSPQKLWDEIQGMRPLSGENVLATPPTRRPPDALGITWKHTTPGDLADAAYALSEQAKGVYGRLRTWLREPPPVVEPFTPQQARTVLDFTKQRVIPVMSKQKAIGASWGTTMRNFALGDYAAKRNYHEWLTYLYPYSYWYTFTLPNWGLRLLQHPSWASNFARYRKAMYDANTKWYREEMNDPNAKLPPQYAHALRVHVGDSDYWLSAERMLIPFASLLEEFTMRERANAPMPWTTAEEKAQLKAGKGLPPGKLDAIIEDLTGIKTNLNQTVKTGRGLELLSEWGPAVGTPYVWAYAGYLDSIGQQEAARQFMSGLILPESRMLRTATAKAREAMPSLGGVIPKGGWTPEMLYAPLVKNTPGLRQFAVEGGDYWDQRNFPTYLLQLMNEGKITQAQMEQGNYSRDMGTAWGDAAQAQAVAKLLPALASYFGGPGVRIRDITQAKIDTMWNERGNIIEQREQLDPDAYGALWDAFDKKYPWNRVYAMGRESDPVERLSDMSYMVLGRLPPSKQGMDALTRAGLTNEQRSAFYAVKGDLSKWTPEQVQVWKAGIEKLVQEIGVPSQITLDRQQAAKTAQGDLRQQVLAGMAQRGFTIDDARLRSIENNYPYDGTPDEKAAYLRQNPELAAKWDVEFQLRKAMTPEQAQAYDAYYAPNDTLRKWRSLERQFGAKFADEFMASESAYYASGAQGSPQRKQWTAANAKQWVALQRGWEYLRGAGASERPAASDVGAAWRGTTTGGPVEAASYADSRAVARTQPTQTPTAGALGTVTAPASKSAVRAGYSVETAIKRFGEGIFEEESRYGLLDTAQRKQWKAANGERWTQLARYLEYKYGVADEDDLAYGIQPGYSVETALQRFGGDILILEAQYGILDDAQRKTWRAANAEGYKRLQAFWNYKYGEKAQTTSTGYGSGYSYGGGGGRGYAPATPPVVGTPNPRTMPGPADDERMAAITAEQYQAAYERGVSDDPAFPQLTQVMFGGDIQSLASSWFSMDATQRAAWRKANPAAYARLLRYLLWLMQQRMKSGGASRAVGSIPKNAPNVAPPIPPTTSGQTAPIVPPA